MEEEEIRKIFLGYLADNSAEEAFVKTHGDICLRILGELTAGQSIDEEWLKMLKMVTETRSRFCRLGGLLSFRQDSTINLSSKSLQELLWVYGKFKEILTFLYRHYETLSLGSLAEGYSKERLSDFIRIVRIRYNGYVEQLAESEEISITVGELEEINQLFSVLVYRAILGQEVFERLADKFNDANRVLRIMQSKITAPKYDIVQ